MKPVAIEFQAFGSYPGRERVDFGPLYERGLFVVSGETGTGKSTVFDAMTFALYGQMPLKELRDIRSHHAPDDVPTFVRFTFDLDGVRHVVERELGPKTAKQRGPDAEMVVKKVLLARIDEGGSTALATKAREIDALCLDMVGLKAEQFQRVVLLPQGDVAKFLLAGTKDREELLGTLFGGALYERITEHLEAEAKALRTELGAVGGDAEHRLDTARGHLRRVVEHLGAEAAALVVGPEDTGPGDAHRGIGDDLMFATADRDTVRAVVARAEAPVVALEAEASAAGERERSASAEVVRREAGERLFDQAAETRARLAALEAARPGVEAAAAVARRSAQARVVVGADDAVRLALETQAEAARRRDEVFVGLDSACAALGVQLDERTPAAVAAVVEQQRGIVEHQRRLLQALADAEGRLGVATATLAEASERSSRAAAELAEVRRRRAELDAERPAVADDAALRSELDRGVEVAAAAQRIRADLDVATSRLGETATAEEQAARRHADVLHRFVTTAAPRLAADLRAGEPCPVCGAVEHPAPAVDADADVVAYDEVERAAAALDTAGRAREEAAGEVKRLSGMLGDDVDVPAEVLAERLAGLRERAASAATAERRLAELDTELASLAQRDQQLTADAAGAETAAEAATATVAERTADVDQARTAAAGLDPEAIDARHRSLAELEALIGGVADALTALARAGERVHLAEAALDAALAANSFADPAAARDALLDEAEEVAALAAADDDAAQRGEAKAALDALEQQGVPVERPDVAAAQAVADEALATRSRLDDAARTARLALGDAVAAVDDYDRLIAASADLRARHDTVARAAKVCAGGGVLNMPLRRWVLSRELDRVTAAANVHLARMSNGRYSLHRRLEMVDGRKSFGLDLDVTDAHTGRSRAPSSLSGGEQFQASLALALGLADVVSHGGSASGRRFEALFVDEGFGSLDPEALQVAIDALHHLHAGGRMVGAITHVEAMKQDLHIGIEVRRLADGRGSTLVVHP